MLILKKATLIIVTILLVFIAYTMISTGFFRSIENSFESKILKQIPITGAEDITVSSIDSFAIISSTNRELYPPTKNEKGDLYLMELKSGNFKYKKLTDNFGKPFAPHGISMIKLDSTYKIMAINHTLNETTIEVFTLKDDKLSHDKTLESDYFISPNDLVMIDENRFYFTNDHKYTGGFPRLLEDYLGLSLSNVIYYDGNDYRIVAEDIAFANGINIDKTRNLIYVASPRNFLIKVYTIENDGSLSFIENIPCGMGVDNIEIDSEGTLWVGGHPSLLTFTSYAKGNKQTSPSEIIKIIYHGKNDYNIEQIYAEDGSTMSGSTVASPFGVLLLIGNVMDDKLLIIKK